MSQSRDERQRDEEAAERAGAGAAGARAAKRRRRRGADAEDGVAAADRAVKARNQLTPRWWIYLMVAFMVAGLVWIVTFYLSSAQYPVPGWDNWNLVAGFALVLVGFAMTTRWR
ncbi:cell division protein CrgA [Kineococcus gypseus]|uniref:cell division protein CrgA n=1 Tax=Kineococcus gypseus TaxID=1637102 RepID=UPI003D7E565C